MTRRLILAVTVLVIMVVLLTIFTLWRVSKAPCFQLVGEVTCRVETNRKIVALSFDDGPTPEGVDIVLSALEDRGIKATFFLIGNKMEKFPGQAERLVAAGHELGNHSYSHAPMLGKSAATYDRELKRTDVLLRTAGMEDPVLFRPPFGKRLIGLPLAASRAGYRTVTWDVADRAASNPEPKRYAHDIIERVRPGSIILIHPMYRHNVTERKAIPLILDGLIAKGYDIVPVGKLLELQKK